MIFRKGVDIDFTALKKRGILKVPEPKVDRRIKVDRDGSIDFTGMANSNGVPMDSSSSSSAVSPFGFLDNLSQASSASSSSTSSFSSLDSAVMQTEKSDLSSLRIKIDDLDFKIGQFMDRLSRIESKLLEFESKVG